MTVKSTRRAVLAGAAALPALSLPALAAEHPDAELIALGRQIDDLQAQFEAAVERFRPQWNAIDAAMKVLEGHYTDDEYGAMLTRVEREFPASGPHPDEISDMMDEPGRRITALTAHTIQGLAVKAKLVKYAYYRPWEKPKNDLDWGEEIMRDALDAVIALAAGEA